MSIKKLKINQRLESFKCFHDFDWANQLDDKTIPFPKLNKLVNEFIAEWRQTTETFTFPFTSSELLRNMVEGFNVVPPKMYEWITLLRKAIEPALEEIVGKPKATRVLQLMYAVNEHVLKEVMNLGMSFDAQAFYERSINDPAYAMKLVGIQQQCFVFLWIAYEDFVVQLYEIVADYWTSPSPKKKDKGSPPKEGYQTGQSTFEDFKRVFGETIAKQCWSDNDITQIREYRHAFVHENGRLSQAREEKLMLLAIKPEANKPESLVIQDDQNQSVLHKLDDSLVIMTHENKTAYNKLKSCVDGIVDYTIANYVNKVS